MLNTYFERAIALNTNEMEWRASQSPGVWSKPLAHTHAQAEQVQATRLVRCDPGAEFPRHNHPLGEEIFVLEGVFSDHQGDYSAGTYLRNAPGTSHQPHSKEGCVLFVKLDQFAPHDNQSLRFDTRQSQWLSAEKNFEVMPLHDFEHESVALYKYAADTKLAPHQHFGGEEFFVISGCMLDDFGRYPAGSWVRNPHNSEHCPFVEDETVIWIKTGHLLP